MVAKSAHQSGSSMPAMVSSSKKQSQKTFFSTRLLYYPVFFSTVKSQQHRLTLRLLPQEFAVCQLGADAAVPQWAEHSHLSLHEKVGHPRFWTVTRTADELSVVCESKYVPSSVKSERNWRCFKLEGPFPFAMTGVLAAVLAPLAEARVSIFAMSTYDTDYVMVKEKAVGKAVRALKAAGHQIAK